MDINEFSIACKLINLKLRSFDIPKVLPAALLISLKQLQQLQQQQPQAPATFQAPVAAAAPVVAAVPTMTATTTPPKVPPMVPPMSRPAVPPYVPPMTMQQQQQQHPPPPQQPLIPGIQPHPAVAAAMVSQPLLPSLQQSPSSTTDGLSMLLSGAGSAAALPAPPTPPSASGTPSRSASLVPVSPPQQQQPLIVGAAAAPVSPEPEWAVRPQSKLKFTQLFNQTDRSRSGYLTGAQARHMMVQSKLPQAALAQIWALADMDADGRLGCEEFVLAMYLCECAAQGEKIPDKLPPELIPPVFRKRIGSVASLSGGAGGVMAAGTRHDSIVSGVGIVPGVGAVSGPSSRHGSVSSQGGVLAAAGGAAAAGVSMADGAVDAMAGLHNQSESCACLWFSGFVASVFLLALSSVFYYSLKVDLFCRSVCLKLKYITKYIKNMFLLPVRVSIDQMVYIMYVFMRSLAFNRIFTHVLPVLYADNIAWYLKRRAKHALKH